jgi:hypothetical protein
MWLAKAMKIHEVSNLRFAWTLRLEIPSKPNGGSHYFAFWSTLVFIYVHICVNWCLSGYCICLCMYVYMYAHMYRAADMYACTHTTERLRGIRTWAWLAHGILHKYRQAMSRERCQWRLIRACMSKNTRLRAYMCSQQYMRCTCI